MIRTILHPIDVIFIAIFWDRRLNSWKKPWWKAERPWSWLTRRSSLGMQHWRQPGRPYKVPEDCPQLARNLKVHPPLQG